MGVNRRRAPLGRRQFLLGSSAVAGGLLVYPALPFGTGRVAPAARNARATASGAVLTGATACPQAYASSNWLSAAQVFDSYLRLPLATTVQKIYLTKGEYFTDPLPAHLTSLAGAGCQFIVCVHPSATTDESAQLAAFLQLLTSNGILYQVALVNEWNVRAFSSPQAYLSYWSRYAPVVQDAGVPVCSLVCASSNKAQYGLIQPGFPTDPLPDAYWIDYYATAYYWGVRLDAPGGLIAQAASAGVPVGIAEFGWGATGGNVVSLSTWEAYVTYLAGLAPRLPLGCLYWGSEGLDIVTGPADRKVAGIQQVVAAFQASSPSPSPSPSSPSPSPSSPSPAPSSPSPSPSSSSPSPSPSPSSPAP